MAKLFRGHMALNYVIEVKIFLDNKNLPLLKKSDYISRKTKYTDLMSDLRSKSLVYISRLDLVNIKNT